jgi:hypothetical protein
MSVGYGVLCSIRHQARKTMALLNSVTAKFGKRIEWTYARQGYVELTNGTKLYFGFHGNVYADYLKFQCVDVEFLMLVKKSFPEEFASVAREDGILE